MADTDDASRFARIALPHLDAAFSLARWLVRDAALAEDVVQEAMLRGLTYIRSYREENPKAWVLRIVRTTAFDHMAQQRRVAEVPLDHAAELPDPQRSPEAAFADAEGRTALVRAVAALPDELRECIVLRELEDMSYRDIARIAGVPLGTVMSRLWRARQMLRGAALERQP